MLRRFRKTKKSVLFAKKRINKDSKKKKFRTFEKDRTFLARYLKDKSAAIKEKYDENGD